MKRAGSQKKGSAVRRSKRRSALSSRSFLRSSGQCWVLGPQARDGASDWSDDPIDELVTSQEGCSLDRDGVEDRSRESGMDDELFGSDQ